MTNKNKMDDWMKEQEKYSKEKFSKDDKEVYDLLFKELNSDIDINIPVGFADKLNSKVQRAEQLKSDLKMYGFYALVSLFSMLFLGIVFQFSESSVTQNLSRLFRENLILVFAIPVLYFLIQSLDRMLLKRPMA